MTALKAPWDFSEPAEDHETAIENLPTPEGMMLGRELARLADVEEARLRERFPRHHPRCDDCAFRLGTNPNGSVPTLMDAVKCVIEGDPFYCHKTLRDGEPRHLCAGYAMLAGLQDAMAGVVNGAERDSAERTP